MYDPGDIGKKGTIFSLPYSIEGSNLILLPVHLDVTVSRGEGTACAPDLVLDESTQLDLAIPSIFKAWELKMALSDRIIPKAENQKIRMIARKVIEQLEAGKGIRSLTDEVESVNAFCRQTYQKIEQKCDGLFEKKKLIGIIGGDHSSPLGLIRSLAKTHAFGILHIDAHMDLRSSYTGFKYSHACIMYHSLLLDGVTSITQVGIRDYAEVEEELVNISSKPVHVFYYESLFLQRNMQRSWQGQVNGIVETLPDKVYISFDVDGLEHGLCPNTGTPVPGGLMFYEAVFLIEQVARSGRKIIGFDVCETGNGIWDANVGARVVYRLATMMGVSQGLLQFK